MNEHRFQLTLAVLLVAIALGGTIDLILDRPASWFTFHIAYEIGLVLAAAVTSGWLLNRWRVAEDEGARLRRSLGEHQAERDAWRAGAERALAGFASAVDRQFETWRLTPAEREVALELLKGRSHKEIAAGSGRSERTIRQHAAAAYEKAGLEGRAQLAAFFLEGLNLPASPDPGLDVRRPGAGRTNSDRPASGS